MTISTELEAKILRYYHVERWRIGTISRQLHVHHSTIKRVLSQSGITYSRMTKRPSMIDPFLPFIMETLEKYPALTASRLYHMVCERGYKGAADHFRHLIMLYRPHKPAEAYLRLKTLPGEQGQVDWGHFGYVTIGKAKRPLMAFVMVLSFSRKIFLQFYLNQRMSNFLRGHEAAFNAWNGLPKVLLYDNLRSAVLERIGDAIRFHPTLLAFASHYRFEPRPVAVARGNEKGRVERAIRYIRNNFFAARQWKDIDDLNAQALHWCNHHAANRRCQEDMEKSVQSVFEEEQSYLLTLPDSPYSTDESEEVKVGKTPYVRFDLNDYSVPHNYVGRVLTVIATLNQISIADGTTIVAQHPRNYEKGKQVEQEAHIQGLIAFKKQARLHRGQDRLTQAVPLSAKLLLKAAERGYHLGSIVSSLLKLLERYGAIALEMAIAEALSRDVPHHNAVWLSLEKHREEHHQPAPIVMGLPNDKRVRELIVRPHNLNDYDQLQFNGEENDN